MTGRVEDGVDPQGGASGPALAGALLRAARERSGRSREDCATALRSRATQIEALELGELSIFGGDVYARGFLRSYARLLGIDEHEVLGLHGHDPAFNVSVTGAPVPLRMRRGMPGWVVGLLSVVAVAGVLATVLSVGGRRAPDVVQAVDTGLAPPGTVTDQAPPAAPPAPLAPAPEPEPGPPIDLVLAFEARSWLEVLVDGLVIESGAEIPAGETLRFTGQEQVVLRLGNAGGVRIESSGEDLGVAGRPGQVLRIVFGPDGPLPEVG